MPVARGPPAFMVGDTRLQHPVTSGVVHLTILLLSLHITAASLRPEANEPNAKPHQLQCSWTIIGTAVVLRTLRRHYVQSCYLKKVSETQDMFNMFNMFNFWGRVGRFSQNKRRSVPISAQGLNILNISSV
eukprot:6475894-Amphidinium_carterae.1